MNFHGWTIKRAAGLYVKSPVQLCCGSQREAISLASDWPYIASHVNEYRLIIGGQRSYSRCLWRCRRRLRPFLLFRHTQSTKGYHTSMAGPDISAGSMLIVLQKIPIIGDHFIKEIPPSDNVGPMSHRIQPVLSFCYLLLGRPFCFLVYLWEQAAFGGRQH